MTAYNFGFVIARVRQAESNGDPTPIPAKGTLNFFPAVTQALAKGDETAFLEHSPLVYHLHPETGEVVDEAHLKVAAVNGKVPGAGVWLYEGVWRAEFGIHGGPVEPFSFEVTTAHTEESPLDLVTVAPYVPVPGAAVNTVLVPVNGLPGQVLSYVDGSSAAWIDPPTGGGGDGGSTVGSSGYLWHTAPAGINSPVPVMATGISADFTYAVTKDFNENDIWHMALTPIVVDAPATINRLTMKLLAIGSGAAKKIDFTLYNWWNGNDYTLTPVEGVSLPSLEGIDSTGNKVVTLPTPINLPPGRYLLGSKASAGGVKVSGIADPAGHQMRSVIFSPNIRVMPSTSRLAWQNPTIPAGPITMTQFTYGAVCPYVELNRSA